MKKSLLFLSLLFCVAACSDSTVDAQSETTFNSLEIIWDDMNQPHEAIPRGVPETMDWRLAPRLSYGNNPPSDWNAMIPWGQIYAEEGVDITAENTRFQIRNMQTWYLSKATNTWNLWIKSSDIVGANYAEDFQNDVNIPADIEPESDGGGISASLQPGYNFHFWTAGNRIEIDPDDIAGVWSVMEARLIVADPNKPDDRDEARLLFSAGADYWERIDSEWDQWKTNGDIGIGRFRFIENDWKAFNMHTLTAEQLRDNPPPFTTEPED
jgi:hypothetical protein